MSHGLKKGDHVLYFDSETKGSGLIGHFIRDTDDGKSVIQVGGGGIAPYAYRGAEDAAKDGQGVTFRAVAK